MGRWHICEGRAIEKDKAALLVVIAALRDGSKAVIAVESGHRESVDSWSGILRDLKRRGLKAPRLVVGDGHLGIWGALSNVFPDTAEQRCWNHRIINILDKISKKKQPEAKSLLTAIPYAPTKQEAEQRKKAFQKWCANNGSVAAGELLERDWDRMVTFYSFPKEHWKHLRTTNPVESPICRRALENRRRQTLQEGRECHGHDLEGPHGSPEDL